MRLRFGGRGPCLGALLWMALSFPALRAEESGSWTNLAGHALRATPVAIQGKTVTLKPDASGKTVDLPLSVFPPREQERLRVAVKDTTVPAGLQSAHAFASRVLQRSRLLYEDGHTSEADYQKTVATTLAALRVRATPLLDREQLSGERLELILEELTATKK